MIFHIIALALRFLLTEMVRDWQCTKKSQQYEMWKNVRLGKIMTTSFFVMTLTTVVFYAMSRLILLHYYFSNENSFSMSKPMFVLSNFFFDTQQSPVFEFIWFCQFFAILISVCAYISFDGFFIFSVLHLCGQLANLQLILEHVDFEYGSFVPYLKEFVERHVHLCR